MTATDTTAGRLQRHTDTMLAELRERVPNVQVTSTNGRWSCELSGAGWRTRYAGTSQFDAVHAAHSTFY